MKRRDQNKRTESTISRLRRSIPQGSKKSMFLDDMYHQKYLLTNREAIQQVIDANINLLSKKYDISVDEFRSILKRQRFKCAVTGLKLAGSILHGDLHVLDTGILKSKNGFILVRYPYAYTHVYKYSEIANIDYKPAGNCVRHAVYHNIIQALLKSELKNYPIIISHNSGGYGHADNYYVRDSLTATLNLKLHDGHRQATYGLNIWVSDDTIKVAYDRHVKIIDFLDPNVDFVKLTVDLVFETMQRKLMYIIRDYYRYAS